MRDKIGIQLPTLDHDVQTNQINKHKVDLQVPRKAPSK